MSETPEHLPLESQSVSSEPPTAPKAPVASEPPAQAPVPTPLPSSPLQRAKMESEGKIPTRSAREDRSTMVAFGLLFVVPVLIIIFAALLLLPYINAQLAQDSDPGGAIVQTGPNLPPPTRE